MQGKLSGPIAWYTSIFIYKLNKRAEGRGKRVLKKYIITAVYSLWVDSPSSPIRLCATVRRSAAHVSEATL